MKLSAAAQLVLAVGEAEARHLNSEELDVEHLIIGTLKLSDMQTRPEGISEADWMQARAEIDALAAHWQQGRVSAVQMRRRLRFLVAQQKSGAFSGNQSRRFQAAMKRADELAAGAEVDLADLLNACLEQESAPAEQVFREFATDKAALVPMPGQAPPVQAPGTGPQPPQTAPVQESRIARYGRDLTALAKAGKLHAVIGRREEMKDVARILNQWERNNAMLVGEAGVGKTAVVEGLAQYACQPDAHESVRNFHFVEITLASLIAGIGPDPGTRLQEVLKAAEADPTLVVFFDEFHALVQAADVLKPALQNGQIHCIGATTVEEYQKHIEREHALDRRFQRVWIGEPSREDTLEILRGLRPQLEEYHGLQISDSTLAATVDFTTRHIARGKLPDKAIILLDQACAQTRIKTFSPTRDAPPSELTVESVAEVVAKQTQLPVARILATARDKERIAALDESVAQAEESLRRRVIGQDRAVSVLARALQLIDTGLEQEGRPFVAMFAGPSGTGKTELAKALAATMFGQADRLITLDMTNFQQEHTVAELIGSPPGYVDSDKVPDWVTRIQAQPNSVVLVDEIEKAHRKVLEVFIPVFDEGRLKTKMGRVADFSHAIFVITSNLGTGHEHDRIGPDVFDRQSEEERRARLAKENEQQVMQAIRTTIRPEVLNRMNAIVVFQPLSQDALYKILDLHMAKVNERYGLAQREIVVALDDSARDFLIKRGYSPEYGARELIRQLDKWVVDPLAEGIAAGKWASGDLIVCSGAEDHLDFSVRSEHATVGTVPANQSETGG